MGSRKTLLSKNPPQGRSLHLVGSRARSRHVQPGLRVVFSVGLPVAPLLRAWIAPKQTFAAAGPLFWPGDGKTGRRSAVIPAGGRVLS